MKTRTGLTTVTKAVGRKDVKYKNLFASYL